MSEPVEAVIVGGGISGLACARKLREQTATFFLITDHLGGRMYHSDDGAMNFGATYVNEDYHRVLRYVGRQMPLRGRDTVFEQGGRLTTLYRWQNVCSMRPILRALWRLSEFRRALKVFRRDAERVPLRELRSKHPLIDRYSRQPAEEFIDELGLRRIDEQYVGLVFRSTAFAAPSEATALFYLGSALPLVVRTWIADFRQTDQQLTAGYRDRIVLDRVVGLERCGDHFEVHTQRGAVYPAKSVVIAAPYRDAAAFYPVPKPYRSTSATMLFVRGHRRSPYQNRRVVVFGPSPTGMTSIWDQGHGWDQVYALCSQPKLSEVYETYELLQAVSWKTAIVLSDAHWVPLELEPGVYLAGDYNICGLEDSFVTGVCAANHVLRPARRAGPFFATKSEPSRVGPIKGRYALTWNNQAHRGGTPRLG